MNMPLVSMNRRRRIGGAATPVFSPSALFALAEPGVWYDPSDVANLAWRRNLLTFTEQFDNAAWSKNATTVVANAAVAPDGTTTADKLVANAATTNFNVLQSPTFEIATYSQSIYAKAAEWSFLNITLDGNRFPGSQYVTFNLSGSGSVSRSSGATGVIQAVGDGWYRCTATATCTSAGGGALRYTPASSNVGFFPTETGNGTSGILIWGAQLELGSVATDYQRISDVNTEVIERFPSATLYQDTAGTIPVTTPGQTVALALDKSKGLVLGSELVDTANTVAGWTPYGSNTVTSDDSAIKITFVGGTDASFGAFSNLNAAGCLSQDLVANKTYEISFVARVSSGGSVDFGIRNGSTSPAVAAVNIASSSYATYKVRFLTNTPFSSTPNFSLNGTFGTGEAIWLRDISVKELPGFHATQATLASRPTYGIVPLGGRRNLLTRTEEFGDALWSKNATTVTANAATAPDGATTADFLIETATNAVHFANQAFTYVSGTTYMHSVYAKSSDRTLQIVLTSTSSVFTNAYANYNLQLGAVSASSGATATIEDVGNGWYRCKVFATALASASASIAFAVQDSPTAARSASYTGNGTSGILIWGAQLETGSSATAYQRVGSAFDVTEAGVASLSYLNFNGINNSMVTPTITPGIDRAQVFAGVRKLSDATAGIIVESSASIELSNGTVIVFTNLNTYGAKLRGNLNPSAVTAPTSYPPPITNVVTAIGDIVGDVNTLRINGAQAATSSADLGTGNYLAYPLYIGMRAGSSLPFNGNIFSLIVRFGTNLDAGTITSTETWVNGKTGAYA